MDERPKGSVLRSAVADRVPLSMRSARVGMDVKSAAVIALAGLIGASIGVIYLVQSRPVQLDQPGTPVVTAHPSAAGSESPAAPPAEELVVDVEGEVRRPGIVRVPAGSRVIDAIEAAGGVVPGTDTSTLNLARLLADGEQLFVGVPPPSGAEQLPPGAGPTPGLVDLNTASLEELERLPGVGPVLAQRIIDYRTEHGRFTSVDGLRDVTGIGEQRFAELKDLVRV